MSTKKVPINKLATTVEGITEEFYQDFAAEFTGRVIDRTPVDEGTLRGSITLSKTRGDIVTDNKDPSGSTTKAKAKRASKSIKLEDEAYVTAGVDYASALEFGTEHMRPQPFMRPTTTETPVISKKVAKDL